MRRHALTANTEAKRQPPDLELGNTLRDAQAVDVLVRDGIYALPRLGAKTRHTVCIFWVEEGGSLAGCRRMGPKRFVGLRANVESPSPIARLERGIGSGLDDLALVQCRTGGVVDAGGNLQLGADCDVAAIFSWRTEKPSLGADGDVAEAAHLKDTCGWIFLIARPVEDRDVRNQAPAGAEAVFDADIEDVLVVFNCGRFGYFSAANEVFVGIEDAVADVDREVMELGRRHRTTSIGVEKLVKSALVTVGCNAPLCNGFATGQCDSGSYEEDRQPDCIFHEGPPGLASQVSVIWITFVAEYDHATRGWKGCLHHLGGEGTRPKRLRGRAVWVAWAWFSCRKKKHSRLV